MVPARNVRVVGATVQAGHWIRRSSIRRHSSRTPDRAGRRPATLGRRPRPAAGCPGLMGDRTRRKRTWPTSAPAGAPAGKGWSGSQGGRFVDVTVPSTKNPAGPHPAW